MKKGLFAVLAAGLLAASANAAIIDLQNAEDGSDSVTVSPGNTADVNLVIITAAIDTTPVAFVNAFLDSTGDCAEVTAVTGGQNWTYDRTAFKLPASLDAAGGNEYGLVSGDQDGGDALPLGSATHVIDTLTLSFVTEGVDLVTFELGARAPQVFGPAPTFLPYVVAPAGLPPIPNFLYVGDAGSNNPGFTVNCVPEPAALGLLAIGGLVAFRRR